MWLLFLISLVSALTLWSGDTTYSESQVERRVNVPSWSASDAPAIFWFGDVGLNDTYADVRLIHDENTLEITVHVIDRLLLYNASPTAADLNLWDAVTLYLNKDGVGEAILDDSAFRFDAQLNWWEPRSEWQASYRGQNSTWVTEPLSFATVTGWRGEALNDSSDDKGWNVSFYIPFASLGISGVPSVGTDWRLAVALHDRDSMAGPPMPDKVWPELMDPVTPTTWGRMHFGIPGYEKPDAAPEGVVTIRHGLDGNTVPDGHVGGSFECGMGLNHWTEWGNTNYAGSTQINIQNQWDISDYPCFSKYFVTFPLDDIPPDKVIIAASLALRLCCNAGGGNWGEAPDSYIQALTVGEDWVETSLTWNNAPLAVENHSGTWVEPTEGPYAWPGIPYHWDVSRAVADAYSSGVPLRLALYSADGERHTGKYFTSSDIDDYNASERPTLSVVWGSPCDAPGITCFKVHLPVVSN